MALVSLKHTVEAGQLPGVAANTSAFWTLVFNQGFGEDDHLTLNAANNRALCLRAKGRFFQAREIDRRTLALRRQVFGEDHPRTLFSALNLSRDLRHTGDFAESTALLRSTLERHLGTLGKDHPDTMRTAGSLAISLRKSGLHDEALQLIEHSLTTPNGVTPAVLKLDPVWDPLRKDPRFEALIDRYAKA